MIFNSPTVSFLRAHSVSVLAMLAGVFFSALSLTAAPLLIVTEPGTKVSFKATVKDEANIVLGTTAADGILLINDAPVVAGTLILSHSDAVANVNVVFEPGKTPGKITPMLKLRPASLLISALPADEVEIFVNGEHRGRGAVTLGGITPREKVTIEARSARRGMQSRVISAAPGETLPVKFDLRGNEASEPADGQIVLPELPLVLVSQPGATIKADGALIEVKEGVLKNLEPGERIIEIFLPWRERSVCVWRAAMPARSAMLPGADVVAVPNPVSAETGKKPTIEASKPELTRVPDASAPHPNRVLFVIGLNVTVSLGADDGLKDGVSVSVFFGEGETPIPVEVSGVSASQAILRLPEGAPIPKDGDSCRLSKKESSFDIGKPTPR